MLVRRRTGPLGSDSNMNHACICDWLGLPAKAWPPDHYRLLGLPLGEGDAARIEQQVHDRLEVVRRYQLLHPDHVTEAMNRLAQAFVCLTDPQAKEEYDAKLLQKQTGESAVEEAIAEAPAVNPADPLAWLYSREAQAASVTRAVTQLDVPAAQFTGPPEDAETRGPDSAPPVRRPVVLPPSGDGRETTAQRDQHDSILEAASSSAPARRGLGTKRALYHRIARTRQLLRIWYEVGQFLGHPGRRLAKPVEATDLIHGLITLRTELKSFPPLLGQAGQPGYLVIALARQQVIVPTFQTLLPSQREALARDWRAGLKLLDAHLQFLRQELRLTRRRGLLGRVTRGLSSLLRSHLGLLLMLAMALATVIALCRSVGGDDWVGQLFGSSDGAASTEPTGVVARSDGPRKPQGSRPFAEPEKIDEPPPPHEKHDFVGPPPPDDPTMTVENKEIRREQRFQVQSEAEIENTIDSVCSVAITSERHFVSCNETKYLSVWDTMEERPQLVVKLPNPIHCVAACAETGMMACGDATGEVYLFQKEDRFGSVIQKKQLPKTHDQKVRALAFSGDGNWLVSGGDDCKVVLWDAKARKREATWEDYPRRVLAVALSRDGAKAYSGRADGTIRVWDTKNNKENEIQKAPAGTGTVNSLTLSPKDDALFWAWKDHPISCWDCAEKMLRQDFIDAVAICLAISPDGRYLVSGEDSKIKVWDAQKGRLLNEFEKKDLSVFSLAYSSDGKYLFSGHSNGVLILWPASLVENTSGSSAK
jgi:WD40 repeat protein